MDKTSPGLAPTTQNRSALPKPCCGSTGAFKEESEPKKEFQELD